MDMMITAITIENFKSIKDPVRIELRPITLLFGPNSVGKSTVIQALHYAREIMSDPQSDVDQTKTGGEHVRLGGFANLVHNHDLNNTIRFRFEVSITVNSETTVDEQFEENNTIFDEILEVFPDDKERIKKYYWKQLKEKKFPWLEIGIRKESMESQPYISYSSIGFGDSPFLTINVEQTRDENDKIIIKRYLACNDTRHPVLRKEHYEVMEALFHSDGNESVDENEVRFDFYCDDWGIDNTLPKASFKYEYGGKWIDDEFIRKTAPEKYQSFEIILNELWNLHVNAVQDDLAEFFYIGPLRQLPDDTKFNIYDWRNPGNWADGLAAWHYLTHQATHYEIEEINRWLSAEKFNTGYKIIRKQHKYLEVNSDLYKKLFEASVLSDLYQVKEEMKNLSLHSSLFFQSINNDLFLKPKDIGVGISQLLPIIPLVLKKEFLGPGLVAIEQPELHIHPAMQTVLGDLFIEGLDFDINLSGKKRFLLETHSEHLLLRLLRRLRDKGDLMNWIEPDDLGIYFMEPGKDGTKATRIRVNEEGEFKNPWPRGFFNERAEELF